MYHWQAGGDMITADGQTDFNNEAGRQVLELWDQFLNVDKVYRLGFEQGMGEGTDAFVTGRVAMLYTGPWMISTYQKYGNELDFGVVDMPEGPGGKASVMGGFGLVIPEASEEKEGAWEFIKWWTAEPENALLWGKTSFNIPGNKKAVEDPFFKEDPYLSPFLDILEYAQIRPTHPGYSIMETDALIPNLELFLNGDQSIEDTLRKAEEQGNEILKNNQ